MSGGRPPATLKARALACVAQREHSRTELRRKLLSHLARASRGSAQGVRTGEDPAEVARSGQVPADLEGFNGAYWDEAHADVAPTGAVLDAGAEAVGAEQAEQAVDQLLDWLAAKDLLSNERFIENRVNARSSRFGNLRIRQELAQHGVELDAEAAQELKLTEQARARAVWTKRFGVVAPDAAGRAKQTRFLAARGFSADVIRRIVGGRED